MMLKDGSYPRKANPLPQTPTPRGLRPHTAERRLSYTLRAPLRSATPKRKEGFALFCSLDHSLRSWSITLTPCPHHRGRSNDHLKKSRVLPSPAVAMQPF